MLDYVGGIRNNGIFYNISIPKLINNVSHHKNNKNGSENYIYNTVDINDSRNIVNRMNSMNESSNNGGNNNSGLSSIFNGNIRRLLTDSTK
mgnify:CR=1 FL=1